MFIDRTYFVGEINIPNSDKNEIVINQAIGQYEKEILIELLGYKLYSLLKSDLSDSEPQTQRFIDLVNGKEYEATIGGKTTLLEWPGLKNDETKQSLIAYYVFYKMVEREVTHLSGTGIIITPSGQGSRASSENKMINAWERMRDLYGKIPPEYKSYFVNRNCIPLHAFNTDNSVYNFLLCNKEVYPEWIFTPKWNINRFGI